MSDPTAESRRNSILIIVVWIGSLPAWVDCTLASCAANPDVDWLFLTDDMTPHPYPANVRVQETTLEELRGRFSEKLGFQASLPRAKKLCDYGPAYGVLFDDLMDGYDFWGHCDLDVVFGDLRRFLTEERLASYEKFFTRGHLAVYRNDLEVNDYFKLEAPGCPDYRTVFTDAGMFAFDEWTGVYSILRYHGLRQFVDEVLVDIVPPTRWSYTAFRGNQTPNYLYQLYYWYKGRTLQAHLNQDIGPGGLVGTIDEEFAYIHFQKRPLPAPDFDPFDVPGFLITPDGFVPYEREFLTQAEFIRHNHGHMRPVGEIVSRLGSGARRRMSGRA